MYLSVSLLMRMTKAMRRMTRHIVCCSHYMIFVATSIIIIFAEMIHPDFQGHRNIYIYTYAFHVLSEYTNRNT